MENASHLHEGRTLSSSIPDSRQKNYSDLTLPPWRGPPRATRYSFEIGPYGSSTPMRRTKRRSSIPTMSVTWTSERHGSLQIHFRLHLSKRNSDCEAKFGWRTSPTEWRGHSWRTGRQKIRWMSAG